MHPVACYWRAYLERQRDEAKSGDYLRRAAELSPDLVFPHRLETLPVLRWAASKTDDWKTTYYLGLLLWSIGEETEAKSLLGGLGGRPAWSPFYLLRARLFGAKEDRPRVLADIKRAVELDRRNWRAWRAETDFYEKAGEFEAALGSAAAVYGLLPEKPALVMDYARALLHSGKYGECLKVLDKTTVLPYEGAWEGHDLFRQANLFLAVQALAGGRAKRAAALAEKARRWPEHLGVGRPFDVDERLENILLAAAYELTGDKGKATGFYESVAEAAGKFRAGRGAVDFISAAALKKLGRESEAVRLLEEWRNSRGEDNPVYAWSSAKYRGDEAKAQDVLERLKATPSGATWDLGTGDRYFRLVLDIGDKALKK
jgi:tetratricopeptide (TPR) repeat protein